MCRLSGISYFRDDPRLFDDRKDITLLDDNVFLVIVDLDFRAGIFGIDDLIAGLDFHLDFLAVNHAAGADCDDLCLLRFLFFLAGKDNAGLCGCLSFQLFQYNSVAQRN